MTEVGTGWTRGDERDRRQKGQKVDGATDGMEDGRCYWTWTRSMSYDV